MAKNRRNRDVPGAFHTMRCHEFFDRLPVDQYTKQNAIITEKVTGDFVIEVTVQLVYRQMVAFVQKMEIKTLPVVGSDKETVDHRENQSNFNYQRRNNVVTILKPSIKLPCLSPFRLTVPSKVT